MSLFDQQWIEGRIPFQFVMPQTSGSGSGELPGTGDLIPDTDTRVIGNTDHRWKELVVEDIQASDTITTNSIQTATATVGGVMNAGQTSVSELTILQSNPSGSLLTGAGTGTFRIRRGVDAMDASSITLTDESIGLYKANGDVGLSLNTISGATTASSGFQANHISSATDIEALGGTVEALVIQGNTNMATPLLYVNSIQPIDREAAVIGDTRTRWKMIWARLVNTTDLIVSGTIEAASQTLSSSLTAASLVISETITAVGQITGGIIQANTNLAAPLLYVNQILPISYAASTLGSSSDNWKEIWTTNINAGSAGISGSASVGGLSAVTIDASGASVLKAVSCTTCAASGDITGATKVVAPYVQASINMSAPLAFITQLACTTLTASGIVTALTVNTTNLNASNCHINGPIWNGDDWEANAGMWVNSSSGTPQPYLKVNYTDLFGTTTLRNPNNTSGIEVGNGGSGLIRLSSAGGVQIDGGGINFDANGLRVKHCVFQATNATQTDTLNVELRPGILFGSWNVNYKLVGTGLPNSVTVLDCSVKCKTKPTSLPAMYSNATNLTPWVPPMYAGALGFDIINNPNVSTSNFYYEAWIQQGAGGNWEVGLATFDTSGTPFPPLSEKVIGQPVTIDIMYY